MHTLRLVTRQLASLASTTQPVRSRWCGRFVSLACVGLIGLMGLTGCVQLPRTTIETAAADIWTGRLSLQVQSEPPQSFSGGFEIKGSPNLGELRLNSPLGNTVLAARWSTAQATLYSGTETRHYNSIDALIEQSTGAALPVAALFDWLVGKATPSNGWTADLTRQPEGHIYARRSNPLPLSELRIVLDASSR
jgi:outer membrane lipoprotein LolB